jgi:hypothetical protein
MIKWSRPLVGLATLVLIAAACGGGASGSPAATAEGSAPPAATDAPATGAPSATETPAAGGDGPDVAGAAAALADLESYDLKITMRMEGVEESMFAAFGDGLTMEGTVIFKPVRAADITMSMGTADQPMDIGYKVIGDQAWVSLGDAWIETPADDAQQTIDSLAPEKLVTGFGTIPGLDTVGDETRNGVATTHYRASGDDLAAMLGDTLGLTDATWTVDFWVAKDGGYAVGYSVTGQGTTGLFEMTLDVSGINDPSNAVEPPPAS